MTHRIQILHLGHVPAAQCSCGKWGYVFTAMTGETPPMREKHLRTAHAEHVAEVAPKKKVKR